MYHKKLTLSKNEENKKYVFRPSIPKTSEHIGKIKRKKRENNLTVHKKIIKPKNISNFRECKTETNSKEKNIENIKTNKNNNISPILKNPFKIKKKNNKNIRKEMHSLQLNPKNNLYDYLYLEYKILQQKRNKEIKKSLALNCPFKPKLNKSYNKCNKNIDTNVFKRLYTLNNNNLKNKIKIIRKINSKTNNDRYINSTNKSYFKPTITRGPINPNQRNLSADNKYYYINDLNETMKENKIYEYNFKKSNKMNYLKRSNNLILKAKNIKYSELFNTLDSDRDGIITSKKIKLSELNHQNLISLTPIFYELQYKGGKMDLNLFGEKIEKLK